MGGAFLGRADDSTAAFANPAGLTNLFSPEFAAEFRFNGYSTPYTSGGAFPDPNRSDDSSNANNLSYLSFVYPKEKWVFALYRQEFMDFNSDFNSDAITLTEGGGITLPTTNSVDVNIVNYGFSTAIRLSDRWSLGASLSYFDYKMDADTQRYLDDFVANHQTQRGSDNSWGVTVGALFRATERFSVGFVYRVAPDFTTQHEQVVPGASFLDFSRDYKFEIPDVYGIGFSFQPNDNLTFNFDIMELRYSQLASPVFWAFEDPATASGQEIVDGMKISNGTEFHLGGEYVLKNKPIALRAGVWHDPDHTLSYSGPETTLNQRANAVFFPDGSSQTHFSVGFGFFLSSFQMDFAADFSNRQDTYSISGVYRFN
jgi:long-subunit fatty acid transport protein